MQIKYLLIVLFSTIMMIASAQQKGITFESSVQAGLLEGQQGSAFQFGFTAGIKQKTWSTAIGTGLDYYQVRSIPLYLNVQKRLFDRQQTPFAYVSGGYNFPWSSQPQIDIWRSWLPQEQEKKGGLYYGAGIGYQLPALKKAALFFAAGYSYKEYMEISKSKMCPFGGPCVEQVEKLTYRFRRLSVTTGLRF
ncbi:MAG TPA: hypothetical protein VF609_05260 [Flavisolibacter sp.]|jgi:hypothetical protein